MIIFKSNELTAAQIEEIHQLKVACRAHDAHTGSLSLSNSINFYQNISSYYFLYEQGGLVSFLMLFLPGPDTAEVSAMTLPGFRGSGCFRALLREAMAELKEYGYSKVLFVHEPCSADGKGVLDHMGARHAFSEYSLCFRCSGFIRQPSVLRLEPSEPAQTEALVQLAIDVFGGEREELASMLEKSFQSELIQPLSAFLGDQLIGLCRIDATGDQPGIYGFGILPEYQGRGFGGQMLNLLQERLVASGCEEIVIDVNSENAAAYHLYRKAGFVVKTQYDYYEYPV